MIRYRLNVTIMIMALLSLLACSSMFRWPCDLLTHAIYTAFTLSTSSRVRLASRVRLRRGTQTQTSQTWVLSPRDYTQPQLAEQTRLACQTRQLPTILRDKYLNELQRALALKTKLAINVTYAACTGVPCISTHARPKAEGIYSLIFIPRSLGNWFGAFKKSTYSWLLVLKGGIL